MKLLYPFARRFIAGYDFNSAIKPIQSLIDEGYEVSVNFVGEQNKSYSDCKRAFKEYLRVIKHFKKDKIDISIKPSQVGILFDEEIAYNYLRRLALRAKDNGHTVRLDMEDSSVTGVTIDLAIRLNKEFNNTGVAIQTNLVRSIKDIEKLIERGVSIRLVKGAYEEKEQISTPEEETIPIFIYEARMLTFKSQAYRPAIATHDERIIDIVSLKIDPEGKIFYYEFLYGVRRDLQRELKSRGYRVRIYIPFGENWLSYTLRRLKEWRNLKFVISNIFKEFFKK